MEAIARQTTLSLTAKLLKLLGIGQFFVQSPKLRSKSNTYLEHPINNYSVAKSIELQNHGVKKIFVAFGTIQGFDFNRGVELVKSIINDSDLIEWQVGYMNVAQLPGITHVQLDRTDFLRLIVGADVVISHGGIGVISDCLSSGKTPLVIPRRKSFGEHVDDHQVEIVEFLAERGLVINLENSVDPRVINDVMTNTVVYQDELL